MSAEGPIVFEMNRLVSYDDESILAELRRVAALLPPGPISRGAFNERARMSEATLRQRFGSWRAALEAAGLGERFTRPGADATPEDVIMDLRRVAELLDKPSVTMADLRVHGHVATDRSIEKTFGMLSKALEAAGLKPSAHQRRWTDDDYFENLLEVWTHYGRPPTKGEIDRPPSRITSSGYARKFGTWVKAKQAFVDRVNSDLGEILDEPPKQVSEASRQTVETVLREDQRAIAVGLRYQVLRRDNFKCVLCGRSPATDGAVVLHVDHILAFSRGGKTRLDNLRSTCQDCNLGKGAQD